MRIRAKTIALAATAAAALAIVLAPAPAWPQADPIQSAATHIAILDYATDQMLYCRRCEEPMPPASMSKLMTAMIVADRMKSGQISPDTKFRVSENAWRHGAQSDGSHMFLELGSEVRVEDLLKGLIIVSANDAGIVLAEGVAGSENAFVDLMNKRAQNLGLSSARFRNVTGLPHPDHKISAADLARLSEQIIREYPELYRLYSAPDFTFNRRTQANRNPLLGAFDGADGVKTGHTSASGYGLIGSAELNGQRRIIVINGLKSSAERAGEAQRLMKAAFFDFTVLGLAKKDETVGEAEVWLGSRDTVPLVSPADIKFVAHRAVRDNLKASIVYRGPVPAPIKKGDVVAELVVEGAGVSQRYPLVAARKVGEANPFVKAMVGMGRVFGGR